MVTFFHISTILVDQFPLDAVFSSGFYRQPFGTVKIPVNGGTKDPGNFSRKMNSCSYVNERTY